MDMGKFVERVDKALDSVRKFTRIINPSKLLVFTEIYHKIILVQIFVCTLIK